MPANITVLGDCDFRLVSHRELEAACARLGDDIQFRWVATDSRDLEDITGSDGIWLAPGSPYADEDTVVQVITWARLSEVPFLGTCSGMQYAVIELVRSVLGEADASHQEVAGAGASNVVTALACSLQGQARAVRPVPGTGFATMTGGRAADGMHFCSYAPDPAQLERLTAAGLIIEATADDAGAEVVHWPQNRFFYASLFQPQVGASAGQPLHPLITAFADAARQHQHDHGRAGNSFIRQQASR